MKKFVKYLIGIIVFIIVYTLGYNFKEAWLDDTREERLDVVGKVIGNPVPEAEVEQPRSTEPHSFSKQLFKEFSALQELKNSIEIQNKDLPKRGDENTTWESAQYGKEDGINYTEYVYKVDTWHVVDDELIRIVKERMVNEFCFSEDYDFYRRNNFGMHFSYYDAKNRLNTVTIKVDNYDCK